MKKVLFLCGVFMFGMTAAASAYYYEESMPHDKTHAIDCADCHGEPDWTGQTPQLPNLLKADCTSCHKNASGGNYTTYNAPRTQSHHGDCWSCHRNHSARPSFVPLVEGGFTASTYNAAAQTTTFTLSTFAANDTDWSNPAVWAAKTRPERGLVLWVKYQDGSNGSFEVVSANLTTITVKGQLSAPTNNTFELLYGQMVDGVVNGNPVIFSGPRTFSHNDELAGDLDFDGIADDSTPDGVCQVCHSQTNHWWLDGTKAVHFSAELANSCTECHEHDTGFAPSAGEACKNCHGAPPTASTLAGPDGLVNYPSPTGSITAGSHDKHSDQYGYTFACHFCHAEGMPVTSISDDDKIQIGFDVWNFSGIGTRYDGQTLAPPYSYEGTHGTTVTTSGTRTCSNIYCHSDGTGIATSFYNPTIYPGPANTTPAWGSDWPDPDGNHCNNCHGYPPVYAQDNPKANSHLRHMQAGFTCKNCHYATTQDNLTISDNAKHHNGVYDVKPSPTFTSNGQEKALTFSYYYDAGGGTCASNSCHQFWGTSDPYRWGQTSITATPIVNHGTYCGDIKFNTYISGGTPPYKCYYEWGDGTISDWSDNCSPSHVYEVPKIRYTVKWQARDAKRHTVFGGINYTGVRSTEVSPSWATGCTPPPPPTLDSDGDGIPDVWEAMHGLNSVDPADALADADGDSVRNMDEFLLDINPLSIDTDGDGIDDAHDGAPTDALHGSCATVAQHLETGSSFNSIAAAYNDYSLTDNGTLMLVVSNQLENLVFNRNVKFTLSGGYSCDYGTNVISTSIKGSLTITKGSVIIENITLE